MTLAADSPTTNARRLRVYLLAIPMTAEHVPSKTLSHVRDDRNRDLLVLDDDAESTPGDQGF